MFHLTCNSVFCVLVVLVAMARCQSNCSTSYCVNNSVPGLTIQMYTSTPLTYLIFHQHMLVNSSMNIDFDFNLPSPIVRLYTNLELAVYYIFYGLVTSKPIASGTA